MEATEYPDLSIEDRLPTDIVALNATAGAFVIENDADADMVAHFLTEEIIPRRQAIEAFFAPLKSAAHKAHRVICEREKESLAKLAEPERQSREKLTAYHDEQERQRKVAEAAAETARLRQEEEIRLQLALEAESDGDAEQAARIIDEPLAPVMVPMPATPAPTRVQGVTFTGQWKVTVTDLRALVRAVASGQVPLDVLQVNETRLNQLARAMGETFRVPGCRAEKVTTLRAGGRTR